MGEKGVRKGGYAYVSLDDHEIIDLFFARKEEGIRELDEKYGKLCGRLALHVLGDPEDAEECVNDAYLAAWKSIPPNRPYSLKAYICRLVRNLSINRRKYNQAAKRGTGYEVCLEELEESLSSSGDLSDALEEAAITAYLEEFLDGLDAKSRWLFVQRFWYMESYRDIAKSCGIRESTLRVRMQRIKKRLKQFLLDKGALT